jgi:hypothetical protein
MSWPLGFSSETIRMRRAGFWIAAGAALLCRLPQCGGKSDARCVLWVLAELLHNAGNRLAGCWRYRLALLIHRLFKPPGAARLRFAAMEHGWTG